ncbi:GT4 family glycosyltransferase PelF [Elusimicrobiota bacterium]
MKILHLISSKGYFGAENVLLTLAGEQQKQGMEVWAGVFEDKRYPHTEITEEAGKFGVPVKIFKCSGRFDLKTIGGIKKFVKDNSVDIIHSHGYKSNIYNIAAGNIPDVKRITTCHNWSMNSAKMRIYKIIDLIFIKKFDKIVAVSGVIESEIIKSGIPKEKVTVINNGIDMDLYGYIENTGKLKQSLGINEREQVIGTIGRLVPEKGYGYLLDAFQKVSEEAAETKLLIVGDGPLKGQLESEVKEKGLKEKVIFTGIRKDISEILSIMDIFVLSSINEGMPMVLLEALSARCPVVSSPVGAIPLIIEDRQTGLLVNPQDTGKLAEAILGLLKDKEKALLLAKNGYERVARDFSAQKMAQKYHSLYMTIAGA